jgi:hypothetical protein
MAFVSTLTISLPLSLAERLEREAERRAVPVETIVRQALELAIPSEEGATPPPVFERLSRLVVNDPSSPVDLATNQAHMEGFGVSHST